MAENPSRYREYSTEHVSNTVDTIRIERRSPTGNLLFDRTTDNTSEQYHYSPSHVCNDTVGFRDRDNPLLISHETGVPALVAFTASHTEPRYDLEGNLQYNEKQTRNYYANGEYFSHCVAVDEPDESDAEFITRAVAGLNPSRASASGAVFMAELRDLPSLFKNLGEEMAEKGFLRGSASTHLGVSFGWAPVIKDLRKFLTIADKVRRRMEELKELRGTGKLRRVFKEKDGRGTQTKEFTTRAPYGLNIGLFGLPSEDQTIWLDIHTVMKTTRWAVIEFTNDVPNVLIRQSDGKRFTEAHRLVYGTSIDGPTIWQAFPWSWLIDWVSNASEYVRSQNNVAGHKLSSTLLMKETYRYTTITPVMDGSPGFNGVWSHTFVEGHLETTTKERILGIMPTLKFTDESQAILGSGFKSSILGALFVTRIGKKIRPPKI